MKSTKLMVESLLDLRHTMADALLSRVTYPWEALPQITAFIRELGPILPPEYRQVDEEVWIAQSAQVAPTAHITGPAIIGPETQVRHGAFIRGSALVGEEVVVGNSTELKNVILFNGVQVPHFNYIGDSILGYRSHMGAGAITSNIKSDKTDIIIRHGGEKLATGLHKFGAILGDYVEIGCNSVLNPGTLVGRFTSVYPLSMVRGVVPEGSIYKKQGEVVVKL